MTPEDQNKDEKIRKTIAGIYKASELELTLEDFSPEMCKQMKIPMDGCQIDTDFLNHLIMYADNNFGKSVWDLTYDQVHYYMCEFNC